MPQSFHRKTNFEKTLQEPKNSHKSSGRVGEGDVYEDVSCVTVMIHNSSVILVSAHSKRFCFLPFLKHVSTEHFHLFK